MSQGVTATIHNNEILSLPLSFSFLPLREEFLLKIRGKSIQYKCFKTLLLYCVKCHATIGLSYRVSLQLCVMNAHDYNRVTVGNSNN